MRRRSLLLGMASAVTFPALAQRNLPKSPALPEAAQEETRRERSYSVRLRAAMYEKDYPTSIEPTNGDEEAYPNKIASFSKCLPHDELGEVDLGAYAALVSALRTKDIADFEAIHSPTTLRIASPLSGLAFNLDGSDSVSFGLRAPHAFSSAEMAADMAELYWMAVLRDVSFTEFRSSPLVAEAVSDLSRFTTTQFARDPTTGNISPDSLFLADYPRISSGPRVSQFLLNSYALDGVTVEQRIGTPMPVATTGIDFLTSYDEWLAAQRGFPTGTAPGEALIDPQPRYIRNMRDMGWNADQSSINSTYLKAGLILLALGKAALDDGNPYKSTRMIGGLGTFDVAHLQNLLGHCAIARHSNFQKWHHRRLRPEAFGGRVHNHLRGAASYPIHSTLLASKVLDRIYEYNATVNKRRGIGGGKGTHLLPCELEEGAATHPSFPAAHGVSAGIGVTLLKAWFDEDFILPDSMTVVPNSDGTAVSPYKAGRDGPPLTIGGELNKLAYNITWGRNMSGVHYRDDGVAGNLLGEQLAIRLLSEARETYAERFGGFRLTKFDGRQISI